MQTSQRLRIDVIDVNDNAPEFEFEAYNVVVTENTELGRLRIQAHDVDSGDNGRVRYTIVDGKNIKMSLMNILNKFLA